MKRTSWALLIVAAGGLLWMAFLASRGGSPEAPRPLPGAAPSEPIAGQPALRVAPLPPPPSTMAADVLVLPDGTRLAALNGVTGATPMEWPAGRAWSPVIGTERSPTGLEWYVHADGTRSTTQWLTSDDGSRRAVATVASPVPVAPPFK